jgi:hypothetical protein
LMLEAAPWNSTGAVELGTLTLTGTLALAGGATGTTGTTGTTVVATEGISGVEVAGGT